MANSEAIPVRFQKHLHRLMPSYSKKDSADPHSPFGHAAVEPAEQLLVNTGTYGARQLRAHRDA
jgi:hypothetical protein